MATRKFSAFTNGGTTQGPTQFLVGYNPALAASAQDSRWTFNDIFAYPASRNVTDESMRWTTAGGAPAVSGGGEASLYFNGTRLQVSYAGGAYKSLLEGTPGAANRVAFFDSAGSIATDAAFNWNNSTKILALGVVSTTNGVLTLNAAGTAFGTTISVQNPTANRTLYLPDGAPTTGNFVYVSNAGAVNQTLDYTTGLVYDAANRTAALSANLNANVGLGISNSNTGTASRVSIDLTETAAFSRGVTSQGFTTSGTRIANQGYLQLGAGGVEMSFEVPSAARFKWYVDSVEIARMTATGMSLTASGATAANPSTLVDLQTGVAGTSGLRLRNIGSTPTASTTYLGVDGSGNVVVAAAPGGGAIGGTIAATQIAFGSGANTISGSAEFIYDSTNKQVAQAASVNGALGYFAQNTSTGASARCTFNTQGDVASLAIGTTSSGVTGFPLINANTNYISVSGGPLYYVTGLSNTPHVWGNGSTETMRLTTAGLVLGKAATATGNLVLSNASTANSTTIQAGNAASALTFIWPVVDPTAGQVLSASAPSGSNVTLSWATVSGGTPGGSNTQVQFNNAGSFGGISGLTTNGSTILTLTSNSATAFNVGPNGTTNPTFQLVCNTASAATGLSITSAAAGGGIALTALSSGSDEALLLNAKGDAAVRVPTSSTSSARGLIVGQYNTGVQGSTIFFEKSRGSRTSPSTIVTGDFIGNFLSQAYDGSAYIQGAYFGFQSQGTVTTSSVPQRFQVGLTTGNNAAFSTNELRIVIDAANYIRTQSGGTYGWTSSTDPTGAPDTILRRAAAANPALGAADAASPVAQTLSVQSVVAGTTDTAGVNWTRKASAGTGTGAGGSHVWQVAPAGSTGSSQNAFVTALVLDKLSNLLLGNPSLGTSAAKCFAIASGTAPTTSPADMCHMYVGDSAANNAELYARNENVQVNRLTGVNAVLDQAFNATSTTLNDVTGAGVNGSLSRNVEASTIYQFEAVLFVDADATGGAKFAVGGTCTATSITAGFQVINTGTPALNIEARTTALGSAVTAVAGATAMTVYIRGSIVVANAGTLTIQFAQGTASGTSTVVANSNFKIWRS